MSPYFIEPLKVPGGSWIVEACSPTYAKEALTTGEFHTPALPLHNQR